MSAQPCKPGVGLFAAGAECARPLGLEDESLLGLEDEVFPMADKERIAARANRAHCGFADRELDRLHLEVVRKEDAFEA
jgi:hypothetical protein